MGLRVSNSGSSFKMPTVEFTNTTETVFDYNIGSYNNIGDESIVCNAICSVGYGESEENCFPIAVGNEGFSAIGLHDSDGFSHWFQLDTPTADNIVSICCYYNFDMDDPYCCFAITNTGYTLSYNLGQGWSLIGNLNDDLSTTGEWTSICYVEGAGFVVVGYNSQVAYSTDGISWNSLELPTVANLESVCFGGQGVVAVGNNATGLLTTGLIFHFPDILVTNDEPIINYIQPDNILITNWLDVCADIFGSTDVYMVGGAMGYIAYSTDCIDWIESGRLVYDNTHMGNGYSVSYSPSIENGLFVVCQGSLNSYSTDEGQTWVVVNNELPDSSMIYNDVCWCHGRFFAVTNSSYSQVSSDGITWASTETKTETTTTTKDFITEYQDTDPDKDWICNGYQIAVQDYTNVYNVNTGESYTEQLQRILGEVL